LQRGFAEPAAPCAIEIWGGQSAHLGRPPLRPVPVVDDMDLPPIQEVDAWQAVEDLEMGAAALDGSPSWVEAKEGSRTQSGATRPATVSVVAALLLIMSMIHAVGAVGSVSAGMARNGAGPALLAGLIALLVGVAETVCAIQVTRGKAWARIVAAGLGALVLLWLTMAPWSPGVLTVLVFTAWLAVGALLAHPVTSRFFADAAPAPATA
jgi:hypothetical protein